MGVDKMLRRTLAAGPNKIGHRARKLGWENVSRRSTLAKKPGPDGEERELPFARARRPKSSSGSTYE